MIAVIIPFYNPLDGWEDVFYNRAAQFTRQINEPLVWVLVNDGSTIKLENQFQYLQEKMGDSIVFIGYETNHGKGYSVRLGVQKLRADYYIYTDIDLPYTTESMVSIYSKLTANTHDVVLGQRVEGYYKNISSFRKYLSKIVKLLFKLTFNISIADTQCGLKAFNQKGKKIFLQTETNRFLFDLEFIKLLSKQKQVTYTTQNVSIYPDIKLSYMGWRVLSREILNLLKIWWK